MMIPALYPLATQQQKKKQRTKVFNEIISSISQEKITGMRRKLGEDEIFVILLTCSL
jgi:hypothetical protein